MHSRRQFPLVLLLAAVAAAQNPPADSGSVIRTETRLVLVDTVVTDKKGGYIRDLTAKDFKVWEDNKEQSNKSFSFEADPASPSNRRPHYLVLFFDNSTMNFQDQAHARDAAAKFVEKSAGPSRFMAVVNFSGALQIPQNFTSDAGLLQAAVKNLKTSAVVSDASSPLAGGQVSRLRANFGARNMLLAVRNLAKGLNNVPGRKILVLFTNGFPVSIDNLNDVTAAIDACNKANVAIYPIDARGLVAPNASLQPPSFPSAGLLASNGRLFLDPAFLQGALKPDALVLFAQTRGGGGAGGSGGGGGGRPVGGPVGGGGGGPPRGAPPTPVAPSPGRTGGGSAPINNSGAPWHNPNSVGHILIPPVPRSGAANQELMLMLADGTGGLVIRNTNDLLAGLDKIGQEQDQYYILGYTPPEDQPIGCHTLRVKVERSGTNVRSRTGYCTPKPLDVLAGNKTEKELESRSADNSQGAIRAVMRLPFFYTGSNVARVNLAMEIEHGAMKFEKIKGKFHGEINLIGIATTPQGTVAARFSDVLKLDLAEKKDVDNVQRRALHYENQFDIAPGTYTVRVVFTADNMTFGKLEQPLKIEPYRSGDFGISGLALSSEIRDISKVNTSLDALLLEDRIPLIAGNLQLVPTGASSFKITSHPAMYFEIYEPLMTNPDPQRATRVAMNIRVLDRKTGEVKQDTGLLGVELPEKGSNPILSQGIRVPVDNLAPGFYSVEIKVVDSAGKSATRATDVDIE